MKTNQRFTLFFSLLTFGFVGLSQGATVVLQQPTATFSQLYVGPFYVSSAIDGVTTGNNGWAIAQDGGSITNSETAVFETATDVGFLGGSVITFTISHDFSITSQHTLGRFRLSITTDNRDLFADGLSTGGDVDANWIVLSPHTFTATSGTVLSLQGDLSILASGINPSKDTYTIQANTGLTGITGVRLEALADTSLPSDGPGRAFNGNFVVTEFQMSIDQVPEPGSVLLISVASLCTLLHRRRIN